MSLAFQSLSEARDGLQRRDFSVRELVGAFLERMASYVSLNAFITSRPEEALREAEQADAHRLQGNARALEGLPLGIKDVFCTKGIRTTAGSKILEKFVPPYESTVSRKLLEAGAIFLGKTNMDEFAMGSSTSTSAFGGTINPWKRQGSEATPLSPGGSSGGSSAAVAAHLCLGAIGSDTGGSVRQPAAFCGIVGLKPTYGRCSRFGMIPLASSLDQAGPMTKTVRDAALLLSVMSGHDPQDSTSVEAAVPDFEQEIGASVRGLRIGVPKEYAVEGMPEEVRQLWQQGAQWLREAGAEIREVSLPSTSYALPAYYIINPAEASSNLARFDGVRFTRRTEEVHNLWDLYERSRAEGLGPEVRRRIFVGTYVLSAGYYEAYYLKARRVQALIRQEFLDAFSAVDLLLTPTAPTGPFAVEEAPEDPVTMYLNDVFTITVNLAGLPALSVPAGLTTEKTPLGLQLIAPPFQEGSLLRAATVLETCADFPSWKEDGA
ncbi:MAG: Asp-tRNA(Asn)/Glu-tRNA(Gln) amidotransferase subunit GatA [Holosporales bacterium]|nr:Asp-tRNA(Asn)/Glu-tRNA(Gln) amidotransferase subunit GatA [Holosporales bacterium]